MSKSVIVSIPHSLGKQEAIRRIKDGLGIVKSKFGKVLIVQEESWAGDELQYRVAALGQLASGTIDVEDDCARLEVTLPWLLGRATEEIQRAIRRQGTALLEKK
jgi:hypothetical protein